MPTTIYIIEDQVSIQAALADCLLALPEVKVCGTARTAQQALAQLPTTRADLALINVVLPDGSGIELVRALRTHYPPLRCIMLSRNAEVFPVQQALAAGAWGYIVQGTPGEVGSAIWHVLAGNRYLSRQLRIQPSGLGPAIS